VVVAAQVIAVLLQQVVEVAVVDRGYPLMAVPELLVRGLEAATAAKALRSTGVAAVAVQALLVQTAVVQWQVMAALV
jgi:hypothetical protein